MVLKRCAWHRRYFRYPRVYGIASWKGRGVVLADGVCPRCTGRIRRDLTSWRATGLSRWEAPMALPPTIVMVIATMVIVVAARPLDWTPPVRESLTARSELPAVDEQDARPVQRVRRVQAPVPLPERVVYVPGWRAATTTAGAAPSRATVRSAVGGRRGAARLDDTGWSWALSAVQAP